MLLSHLDISDKTSRIPLTKSNNSSSLSPLKAKEANTSLTKYGRWCLLSMRTMQTSTTQCHKDKEQEETRMNNISNLLITPSTTRTTHIRKTESKRSKNTLSICSQQTIPSRGIPIPAACTKSSTKCSMIMTTRSDFWETVSRVRLVSSQVKMTKKTCKTIEGYTQRIDRNLTRQIFWTSISSKC